MTCVPGELPGAIVAPAPSRTRPLTEPLPLSTCGIATVPGLPPTNNVPPEIWLTSRRAPLPVLVPTFNVLTPDSVSFEVTFNVPAPTCAEVPASTARLPRVSSPSPFLSNVVSVPPLSVTEAPAATFAPPSSTPVRFNVPPPLNVPLKVATPAPVLNATLPDTVTATATFTLPVSATDPALSSSGRFTRANVVLSTAKIPSPSLTTLAPESAAPVTLLASVTVVPTAGLSRSAASTPTAIVPVPSAPFSRTSSVPEATVVPPPKVLLVPESTTVPVPLLTTLPVPAT